jgi:molybdate transport system ATP-binding protein
MFLEANIHLTRNTGFELNAHIEIPDKGVTALFGPSGSGKSTLLRLFAGLEQGSPSDKITIISNGATWQSESKFVAPHLRSIGFVSQQPQLFPHTSVLGNLKLAQKFRPSNTGTTLPEVIAWLELEPLLATNIHHLSGGEAQRVSLARALVGSTSCLLMDEPLASIDAASKTTLLEYIQRLSKTLSIPIVYVSHSLQEIQFLADRIYLLDRGSVINQGSMLELGNSVLLNQDQGDTAGSMLFCETIGFDEEFGLTRLAVDQQQLYVTGRRLTQQKHARISVPARDISITLQPPQQSSILNILEATVIDIEQQSDLPSVLISLQLQRQTLLARITRKSLSHLSLTVGQKVFAQIKSISLLNENLLSENLLTRDS